MRTHVATLLFLLALSALASASASDGRLARALSEDPPPDAAHPAAVVELTIESSGQRLPGHIYLAPGPGPHPTVILLHGFPGNERNLDIAQALRRFGFNTLFFHYRGAWGAEGEYTLLGQANDVEAVIAYLTAPGNAEALRVKSDALSLLGHSLGGFTALSAGAANDDLRCIMALSPANLGAWKTSLKSDSTEGQELAAYAESLFMLRGLSAAAFRTELSTAPLEALDTRRFARGLRGKLLLMLVGEADLVTPAATMFDPVVATYRQQSGLDITAEVIAGDHSFSGSRLTLTRRILEWADSRCR